MLYMNATRLCRAESTKCSRTRGDGRSGCRSASLLIVCLINLQVAVSSSSSTGSIDIDELAGRKLSIWDLLRFTLPTLGVWVINPILRCFARIWICFRQLS